MKVGDLVRYRFEHEDRRLVGIILQIDPPIEGFVSLPYQVRWTDHTNSQRDWYDLEELVLI